MLPTRPIRYQLEALPSKSIFINWRCSLQNNPHLSWGARFKWRHPPRNFASTCMELSVSTIALLKCLVLVCISYAEREIVDDKEKVGRVRVKESNTCLCCQADEELFVASGLLVVL